jgi:hypothetical protein
MVNSALSVRLNVKPMAGYLIHTGFWEGPCRAGKREDLDPEAEKRAASKHFASLAAQGFVKVWQAAVLSLLLTHEKINQDRVNMLNSWKHSGFSIDSSTRILDESDREALGLVASKAHCSPLHPGQYIVRGATCAEKISYDAKTDTVTWTASPKGFYKGKKEHFRSFEFMDQLMAHLPPRLQGRAAN